MWDFTVRGRWRPNITEIFWPQSYGRQRCVFLVLLMPNRNPGVDSAGCWLSLLHLISNFCGAQFIRAPSPFGLVWLSLPPPVSTGTRTQLNWHLTSVLTELYNSSTSTRPADLWNRMFNRHQAEMLFRGHSLPVRQSMRVSWDFLACTILLANFRPCDFLS